METYLIKEFQYFLDHQAELVEKYNGKFVVIKDNRVIGSYDKQIDAITKTANEHEPGTYLIQKCEPGPDCYTQTFHSRVSFS